MSVNIYEEAIQPIVDLDTDVVVYVPGFAKMGPTEPTLVTKSTFASLFGDSPYIFKATQNNPAGIEKNSVFAGSPDKSWLYAKGLVEAGLTVLFHRQYPETTKKSAASTYTNTGFESSPLTAGFAIGKGIASSTNMEHLIDGEGEPKYIQVRAKYKGRYYQDIEISISKKADGLMTVKVAKGTLTLESKLVSLDPESEIFIENVSFAYINFYTTNTNGFRFLNLDEEYAALKTTYQEALQAEIDEGDEGNPDSIIQNYLYLSGSAELEAPLVLRAGGTYTPLAITEDEITIAGLITSLAGTTSPMIVLEDTEQYTSISYVTSGGYYQTQALAKVMLDVAFNIKAIALIDFADSVDSVDSGYTTLQSNLGNIPIDKIQGAKGASFVGADTYIISSYKVVIADSFGYLQKLGANMQASIPYWLPPANSPNGVLSATATTRPISKAVRTELLTKIGVSVNPIIYKQADKYTIMGNRTLYKNNGVLGPQSFLNCQIVVNAIERVARRAAQGLLIVSTDPLAAFRTFKSKVSKVCDKFLVNGDGLAAYSITKLKKTQPATIDTVIDLTIREGIEEWNIKVPYALSME